MNIELLINLHKDRRAGCDTTLPAGLETSHRYNAESSCETESMVSIDVFCPEYFTSVGSCEPF